MYHVPTGFGFSLKANCFLCFCFCAPSIYPLNLYRVSIIVPYTHKTNGIDTIVSIPQKSWATRE